MTERNPIQVAERIFDIFEILIESGTLGLSDVVAKTGLNKSTVHRILSSLQYMGYVSQRKEDGRYEPTLKIVGLSEKVVNNIDILGIVRPYLRELMESTGETVHFVRLEGTEAVYIDKIESNKNSIQMVSRIGNRIPLYCSGVGKAMLAEMDKNRVKELWKNSDIIKKTKNTITSYTQFMKVLDEVRKNGYALDNEENEQGVRCIAAALNLSVLMKGYAFSISMPSSRMDEKKLEELSKKIIETKIKIESQFNTNIPKGI